MDRRRHENQEVLFAQISDELLVMLVSIGTVAFGRYGSMKYEREYARLLRHSHLLRASMSPCSRPTSAVTADAG